jgi:DNA-binding transcriptional regulator YiaG
VPSPVALLEASDVGEICQQLTVSQAVFASLHHVSKVKAMRSEKGR